MKTRIDRSLGMMGVLLAAVLPLAGCGDDTGGGDVHEADGDARDGVDVPDGTDGPEGSDAGDGEDGEAVACEDLDRDLHGIACAAGLDCDDSDPAHFEDCATCLPPSVYRPAGCVCLVAGLSDPCYDGPMATVEVAPCAAGTRVCDETRHLAAECVGQRLPEAAEVCGDGIDNNCNGIGDEEAAGPCGDCDTTCQSSGSIEPDPLDPGSIGLDDAPDDVGVVLGIDDVDAAFAWIPNTAEGSVSRIDIETGAEMGRYRVGQTGGVNDAPSRTAVDGVGDLYVANMANVSASMQQGSVTKIAGDAGHCADRNLSGTIETSTGSTRLPLNSDECVLWTVPVCEAGAIPRALAVTGAGGGAGAPWVGCWSDMEFHKLGSSNGTILSTLAVEVRPFGAVATSDGWIWIASRESDPGRIQRFEAATGGLDPAIDVPAECDPWGIAADGSGRVWIGGTRGNVCRYDPSAYTWQNFATPRANAPGVAVDPDGNTWALTFDGSGTTLMMFPPLDTDPTATHEIAGSSPNGIAADSFGYVWTINTGASNVTRFVRATAESASFGVGGGPVGYGSFTGLRRTIVATSGVWVQDFARCDSAEDDRWGVVRWGVEIPGTSSVSIAARSAASAADLAAAPVVPLVTIPPGSVRVDIESAFAAAAMPAFANLRIEVTMTAGSGGESPVLRNVEVQWHCGG